MSYGTPQQNSMYQRGGGGAPGGTPGNGQYGNYQQQNQQQQQHQQPHQQQQQQQQQFPPSQNQPDNKIHSSVPGYANSSPPSSSFASSQQQEDNSKNKGGRRRMSMDARVQTKQWVEKNSGNLLLYFGLIVGIFIFYHAMSDGDFSFLLTLGSVIRTFAFGLLLAKIISTKSVNGVSLKMIELYVVVFACRLASILFYEGYLPFDSSGDYLYRGMEIAGFLLCIGIGLLIVTLHKDTYQTAADSFGAVLGVPSMCGIVWVMVPSFCLALVFHPSLNANMVTDVAWTFALALESTAILPQIIMFIKSLKEAKKNVGNEEWISHIIACLGMARLIHLIFWLSSYTELNDQFNKSPGGAHVGHFVVFSQCVQLLLMCDYLYYYVKALYSGGNVTSELQSTWATSGRTADEFA